MLWAILSSFREKQKTRADGAGWRRSVYRQNGGETLDGDGKNPVELPVLQSLLLFQLSPLQQWDKRRTEMLTSVLTTSSSFWLNICARKMPQRSLCSRIPMQVMWRDLPPLLHTPFSFRDAWFPWWQVEAAFQMGQGRKCEWVLVHVAVEAFLSPLAKKIFQFCSMMKKHCIKSSSMTLLCSAGPWPSVCMGTWAAICLGLPSWEAASVASDIIR